MPRNTIRAFMRRQLNGNGYENLPGGFPQDNNAESNNNNTTNENDPNNNSTNEAAANVIRQIRLLVLRIPLLILYVLTSILLLALALIKKYLNFNRLYDKISTNNSNPATELSLLLDKLSAQSNYKLLNPSSTYTFGSLYNSDSCAIPISLIQQSYIDLLQNCAEQCKFGLIYLHDPLLNEPMKFVDNILCNERFVNCIKNYQILLWFSEVTSTEGFQVANSLSIRQFPFIGIVALNNEDKVQLITKIAGSIDNYKPNKIEDILAKTYPRLLRIIEQRQSQLCNENIREEQDRRFRESLRRDQQREHERELQRQNERLLQETEHEKLKWLLWQRDHLHREPNSQDNVNIAKIAIRMDNKRFIRNFDSSLQINEIYIYVELIRNNLLESTQSNMGPPSSSYIYQFNFTLIVPVPRKELSPDTLINDEPSICPSGNILVETEG